MAKYLLSEDDRETLNDLIRWWRRSPFNAANRAREPEPDYPGSGCYVVLAPPGGLPALDHGPLTGTGTGSGEGLADDVPGYAECDVYQLLDDGTPVLERAEFTLPVYNLTDTAVEGGTWLIAVQDKWGAWVADVQAAAAAAAAAPAGSLTVEDVDAAPSYGSVSTLRFDSADGFSLTNPAANVARVDLLAATPTQAGIVSTADQVFAGGKEFSNKITIWEGISGTAGTGEKVVVATCPITDKTFDVLATDSANGEVGGYQLAWDNTSFKMTFTLYASAVDSNVYVPGFQIVESAGTLYVGGTSGVNSDDNGGAAGSTGPMGFFGGIYYGGALFASSAPSTASDTGYPGQLAYDGSYWYVCTAADTWKRVAIASW